MVTSFAQRWPLEYLTRDQVTPHNNAEDCWVILHGLVFDVTPYLRYHPGGQSILLRYAGTDVSVPFRKNGWDDHFWFFPPLSSPPPLTWHLRVCICMCRSTSQLGQLGESPGCVSRGSDR